MSERKPDEFDRLLDLCTDDQKGSDPEKVKAYVNRIHEKIPVGRRRIWILLAAAVPATLLLIGFCLLIASYVAPDRATATTGKTGDFAAITDGESDNCPVTTTTTRGDGPDTTPDITDGERMATFSYLSSEGEEVRCQEKVYNIDSMIRRWMELSGRTDLVLVESSVRYTPSEDLMIVSIRFEYPNGSEEQEDMRFDYLRESILMTYPEFDGVEIVLSQIN